VKLAAHCDSPDFSSSPTIQEKAMNQKIRITTRAGQFEQRKQEHLQAGYQVEDEQPFPINGFCSFTAVRMIADDNSTTALISDDTQQA
jgi:hypothetical protein